jgi:hypothetical protein
MSPPHPFVLEPPGTEQVTFSKGSAFSIDLLLFGFANDYLAYFVYAFEEMGRLGLGRSLGGRRASFQLVRVTRGSEIVYDPQDGTFQKPSVQALQLRPIRESPTQAISTITVTLETPLRLKFANEFSADLPFHVLVRGMLRRVSVLNEHFGAGEPDLDYRGLVARAEKISTVKSTIRWFDWERYSNRQDRAMLMGGIIGEITYGGCLDEFVPLLEYCEIVHVGKATAFGLGKIRVQG